jgi:ATP-dependent DNA helicase RecQ
MDKFDVLKQWFGHDSFREGQEEIVDAILSGRDIMGIMPTGAGKSVCYQLPALMLSGITVVVSPLISLMKDQVTSLVQSGIKAAYINSSLTAGQYAEVFRRAYRGAYKIIYVAPERLLTSEFITFSEQTEISMVTVDEAHCVSQWGQDFRPGYLKIAEYIERLSYRPIVAAFTATATSEVKEDIIGLLRLRDPFTITTGFDRKNLYFEVIKPRDKYMALKSVLEQNRNSCGIVYCLSRKGVEEVCEKLNKDGYRATRYHAGLDERERHANQDDFIYDRCNIMVATNAFGMGIDKSDVAFVVHYNMPKNLESYYQEAGRAGRDGSEAACVLLYSGQDVRLNQFLIENSNELNEELTEEMRDRVRIKDLERLRDMTFYCTTTGCLREYMLRYFGEKSPSFCGKCSSCNITLKTADVTDEARSIVSSILRLDDRGLHFGKIMIFDILRGEENERITRMHLDSIGTYGILGGVPQSRLRAVCDYLIENGYLRVMSEYSTLAVCEKSDDLIAGRERISIRLPEEKTREKSISKSHIKTEMSEDDAELFVLLKEHRLKLARRLHVPAYVVFADATLKDMAIKRPTDMDELLRVSGVGSVKADKYGKSFCKLIREYMERD